MIQSQNVVFIKKNSIYEINKNQIKIDGFSYPLILEERKVSPLYLHR